MTSRKWNRQRAALALCAALSLWAGAARAQTGWVSEQHGPAGKDLNAVYFSDSKRGWVGGDAGLILRTEDGGRTWEQQQVGAREGVSDLYFRDKTDGYLLAGNQILVTEDGGASWRMAARFLPSTFAGAEPDLYSVRFTSKRRGWVVGSLSRGDNVVDSLVLQTTDGGASWNRQRVPVTDELIHLDFDGDKRGWIVGASGRILHTRDGGESWTLQESKTTATLYHVEVRGDERGWAVGERGTILRTVDGGETWTAARAPVRSTLLSVKFVNDEEGWAVGRGGVILRTGDGGQTWVQQESRTRQHLYALFFDKKTGWAVGGDGLIFRYER
jgi:photosystem II stability/assembly factor-like uncharacterized protein